MAETLMALGRICIDGGEMAGRAAAGIIVV